VTTELFRHLRAAVDRAKCEAWVRGVYEAREAWVHDFKGAQHSLGRAWYTHLEQGRASEYFAKAKDADALVERFCPGLQSTMRDLAARVVEAPIVPREGWCSAGVHVFPANGLCATRGGDIHFDDEGLTPAHKTDRAPALTLVLMLQPADTGGGLRVWDVLYRGSNAYEDADLARPSAVADYATGDLVVMDSYRLHQIQPFTGATDRISATLHLAESAGAWESWF
jgi:hypothetical protein